MSMPSYDPNSDPSAQPGYGQQQPYGGGQQGYGAPARPARNGLGVAALVLGILAIVTSFTVVGGVVLGIVGLVLGIVGRKRAKRGEATNGGVALAGIITSVVGVLLSILLVALGAAAFFGSGGGDYVSCVNDANGNQSQIQQCANEFQQNLDSGN